MDGGGGRGMFDGGKREDDRESGEEMESGRLRFTIGDTGVAWLFLEEEEKKKLQEGGWLVGWLAGWL